jgi:hypothetical protein
MPFLQSEIHRTRLEQHLLSPEAGLAYALWRMARRSDGLVERSSFERLPIDRLQQDFMVLEPDGEDWVYRAYGTRIAHHSGYNMTGNRLSAFEGELGDFYRRVYREVLAHQQPILTVHRLGNFQENPLWERLILPVMSGKELSALYVLCFVRSLEHQAPNALSDDPPVPSILTEFCFGDDGKVSDLNVTAVNRKAADRLGLRPDEMLGQSLLRWLDRLNLSSASSPITSTDDGEPNEPRKIETALFALYGADPALITIEQTGNGLRMSLVPRDIAKAG